VRYIRLLSPVVECVDNNNAKYIRQQLLAIKLGLA